MAYGSTSNTSSGATPESGDVKIGDVKDFLIKNNYKKIFKSKLRLDYVYSNF